MSVAQACAEAQAAIERARSLFAATPEPAASNGVGAITGAAQSNSAAGHLTGEQSGELIDQHRSFVDQSAGTLAAAARSDATLNAHVTTAGAITQTGAARLAAIAAETQATSRVTTTSTPAGERAVLAALRSQVQRASPPRRRPERSGSSNHSATASPWNQSPTPHNQHADPPNASGTTGGSPRTVLTALWSPHFRKRGSFRASDFAA
jgi:hypothetical protein